LPPDKSDAPKIEFRQLDEVDKADILELLNHPLVRRQMPLAKGHFDDAAYRAFITTKKQLWIEHGYGPWAFFIDEKFAGWGGLQWEQGDADLALVLHPQYWGMGKLIYEKIIEYAFCEMNLSSITILLPPSRKNHKILSRYHFKPDGEATVDGELFLRFRLFAPDFRKWIQRKASNYG
jgi:ribosomal-protein-alanine N-acetyltransferase